MVIIDTSVWIEFFRGKPPLFDQVSALLDRNEIYALSPVFGELLQGAANNGERRIIMEFWENLMKIQENGIFLRAGAESGRNKWTDRGVGLIDAVIITAVRETGSLLWSLDAKLLRLLKKEDLFVPGRSPAH